MTSKTKTEIARWAEIATASGANPPVASWVQSAAEADKQADIVRQAAQILHEYAEQHGLLREYGEQLSTARRWEAGWRSIARRYRMDFGGAVGVVRVPVNPNNTADRAAREAKKAERRRQDAALRASMKGRGK